MNELCQTFINRSEMSATQCQNSGANANRFRDHIQLPPCTMEVFRSDYKSWSSFRDMFTAVYVDGANISSVEQLFYLKQFTLGEALEIVKKSPLTTHGFQNAWNNLRDRFENNRILVNYQLKILFTLEPIKLESAHEVKGIQRDINTCISAWYWYL